MVQRRTSEISVDFIWYEERQCGDRLDIVRDVGVRGLEEWATLALCILLHNVKVISSCSINRINA
jgi:hypothetical protein